MNSLKIVIGTIDKASADEVYKLASGLPNGATREEDKYGRACRQGGRDCLKEGGNPADRDPFYGRPCWVVRFAANGKAIHAVLKAVDPHLAAEWARNQTSAVSGTGRVWWVLG